MAECAAEVDEDLAALPHPAAVHLRRAKDTVARRYRDPVPADLVVRIAVRFRAPRGRRLSAGPAAP